MQPDFSTDLPQIAPGDAAKMIEAKRRLLERFKRDERGQFQPTTLQTTPEERDAKRLPDGQHLTNGFPILDLGTRPDIRPEEWTLKIWGEVENPVELSWDDFKKLPRSRQVTDFHCVTTWSKYEVPWGGIHFSDLAALVRPTMKAKFVIQHGGEGYTTNTPLEEMMDSDVLLADEMVLQINGEDNGWQSIPRERGGPVRMIVPKLYAWKGSKFLVGLRFQERDEPGFWEVRGYNNHADPWRNERYGSR
jgi:DMSO/TMAO reductase YedYZ molybdopterin-dependent catalytic subunit